MIVDLISELEKQFEVKNLENATWLLEIYIEYNEDDITLFQTAYIEKLLRRYGMKKFNSVLTLMIKNIKLLRELIEK
jgi:hypothetical protein